MNGFIHFADPALGTSLSFPGLGLELSLNREAVFIGPLTIYWYGIIVVTGIALGIWYAVWRAGQFGIDRDRITDVILYSVLAAIVGARLYYVAFSWDYYSAHPEEIIAVWKGGIAFYGGVIGALLVVTVEAILPYALAFAAGAMILVAVHELIPECQQNQKEQPYCATMGIILGFAVMMLLDVMLG